MKKYMVRFQGEGHDLITVEANNNNEARKIFNRNISIKEIRDQEKA